MKKIALFLIIFLSVQVPEGFAQWAGDGSYFWNSIGITYTFNEKTELVLANKDQYSNQIDRLDYLHFELIGYRKLSQNFSMGLGIRQTESYQSEQWNHGQTYLLYGVYFLNPGNLKIRFANRIVSKTYKTSDTQFGLDNITDVDFFVKSPGRFPKPYLKDEIFTNLNRQKVQTIRIYGGLHVLKRPCWSVDLYYCFQNTRPSWEWKEYHVFGLSTKFSI